MQQLPENVILFPKWRTILEEESLTALKEKKYAEALSKLDKLLSYQVDSYEIISGKLICLMELGRHQEAQDICEELLKRKDAHYYHYLHIYLTILFQTNQYDLLMEQVDFEFATNAVPPIMQEQFQQLYDMSSKMKADINVEHASAYLDDLTQAISSDDYKRQWQLIEDLRKLKTQPTKRIRSLLLNKDIHPVIKSAIFMWLQEVNDMDAVEIHKWDKQMTVKPSDIGKIHSLPVTKQILLIISELEQTNPSMFELLYKLIHHYMYVRYPVVPPEEDAEYIAKALKQVGSDYLNIHTMTSKDDNEKVKYYIEEIELCETLYASIIEE